MKKKVIKITRLSNGWSKIEVNGHHIGNLEDADEEVFDVILNLVKHLDLDKIQIIGEEK